eukprot:gene38411-47429_t
MAITDIPLSAWMSQLLLGLVNGSFYAMLSLGLAVIFGLLNVINFSHGALYMMGAFLAAVDRRKAEAQSAQAMLTQAQHTLQRLELMLGAQSAMLALQRQYSEAVLWNALPIRQQVRKVQLALEENDGAGATVAQTAVTELGMQLAQASLAEGHLRDVRQAVSLLGKMGLSGDDRLRVQALSCMDAFHTTDFRQDLKKLTVPTL